MHQGKPTNADYLKKTGGNGIFIQRKTQRPRYC